MFDPGVTTERAKCPECRTRLSQPQLRGLCPPCHHDLAIRNKYPCKPQARPGKQFTGLCRHCRKSAITRPRGLCWGCYYTPGVKELYPITSKYARKGVGNGFRRNPPLPAEPTDAEPGSAEKIRILTERARRGESLFHPDDAQIGAVVEWEVPEVTAAACPVTALTVRHRRGRIYEERTAR